MTMPSKGDPPLDADPSLVSGRLHPWSWLFVLLAQLRSFALPLVAVFVFGSGKGEQWQFYGMLAGLGLALVSVAQYFTYRYGVVGDELIIRAGILHRNRRHIPLSRIRNVSLHQSLLHRLFGVAEVRLESAGGNGAEARMRVLSVAAAKALEDLIEGGAAQPGVDSDTTAESGTTLLQLDSPELIRLGVISNRGMVVVAAAAATLWQLSPDTDDNVISEWAQSLFGRASALHLSMLEWIVSGTLLVILALILLRVFSVLLAVLQFHGFLLRLSNGRLSVERGLLTRVRANAPPRKIQFWNRRESLLQRWLGRQSLQVETAVVSKQDEAASALNQLVPIGRPEDIDRVLHALLPSAGLEHLDWRPIHPRAWRRMVKWPLLLIAAGSAALAWRFGWPGLLLLALAPLQVWRARRLAAACGWVLNRQMLYWRSGWLNRQQSFAEVSKLQGLELLQSPFDRRHRMATLRVDTAGANPISGNQRIHIRYLPEATARDLYRTLAGRIAATPLSW